MASEKQNRYSQILEHIFHANFSVGATEVPFTRDDIQGACRSLGIEPPKNLGDVIYAFRYRLEMPTSVQELAPQHQRWILVGRGRAKYAFVAISQQPIVPNAHLTAIKVPDSTPGLISQYSLTSEQALLAILRYNRLIDLFTGVVCYSLQNHLRAYVEDVGQVETDEIYLGVSGTGAQYVIPVEAKSGADRLSVVQMNQDLALCKEKFPDLECQLVGAQFVSQDVALFLFAEGERAGSVEVLAEKRYRLVPPSHIEASDLRAYRRALPNA